jgi:hypothetical protein
MLHLNEAYTELQSCRHLELESCERLASCRSALEKMGSITWPV